MSEHDKPKGPDVSSVRLAATERVTSVDPRAHAAWRTWLAALAKDADAVTAAVLAYDSLEPSARDAWLDALDADAPSVDVPRIALYAPLLSVEQDDDRRERIVANVVGGSRKSTPPRALAGTKDGDRVCLIVSPLYLDFVELLLCRYNRNEGIREARHKWLAHKAEVTTCADDLHVKLADSPLSDVVEDLAHAVVADRRMGRTSPAVLARYIDLFAPDLPEASTPEGR